MEEEDKRSILAELDISHHILVCLPKDANKKNLYLYIQPNTELLCQVFGKKIDILSHRDGKSRQYGW